MFDNEMKLLFTLHLQDCKADGKQDAPFCCYMTNLDQRPAYNTDSTTCTAFCFMFHAN